MGVQVSKVVTPGVEGTAIVPYLPGMSCDTREELLGMDEREVGNSRSGRRGEGSEDTKEAEQMA
jgi:hypothetical protein